MDAHRLPALPYFKFLKERGNDVGRADFARLQRETLENYLIGLIRAVVRLFVIVQSRYMANGRVCRCSILL